MLKEDSNECRLHKVYAYRHYFEDLNIRVWAILKILAIHSITYHVKISPTGHVTWHFQATCWIHWRTWWVIHCCWINEKVLFLSKPQVNRLTYQNDLSSDFEAQIQKTMNTLYLKNDFAQTKKKGSAGNPKEWSWLLHFRKLTSNASCNSDHTAPLNGIPEEDNDGEWAGTTGFSSEEKKRKYQTQSVEYPGR